MDGQKWFKFYGQDWLTDLKIMRLSVVDRICYVTLLCLASSSSEQGVVHDCDEYSIIALTHMSNDESESAIGFLDRLIKLGMVEKNGLTITIKAFAKRQTAYLTDAERSKNYRDRRRESDDRHTTYVTNVTLEKSRVEKSREEKKEESVPDKPERHISYLLNLPTKDLEEFKEKYNVYDDGIKGKADELYNYCKAKGKVYKDYKAFLSNALKKDFGLKRTVSKPVVVVEITEEQRQANVKKLAEMKKGLFKKQL